MLVIENICVSFGATPILKGVNLSVEKGKVYTLVGGNGSGKTTLINVLSGFLKPNCGRVLLNGNNNILSIDENKNIYKENGSLYSYKNGKIYLTRDTSLPSQYQKDIWTSTKGVVFSPFSSAYDVTVTRGSERPLRRSMASKTLQNSSAITNISVILSSVSIAIGVFVCILAL